MRTARRQPQRVRVDANGSLDPRLTYTKRGLLKAIGLGEEALTEAVHSGKVRPRMIAGRNFYRGSEIEAWIWGDED